VHLLFNNGANINTKEDFKGTFAFLLAVKTGEMKIAQWLVNQGADINVQMKYGKTALMLASQNLEMLRWLEKVLEDDKMNKRWPKTHKLLPKNVQNSVEETLCVFKMFKNIPKELTWVIITLMITITKSIAEISKTEHRVKEKHVTWHIAVEGYQ